MSVAYFSQVMRLRLPDPTEKLVLLAFAEHANEDGLTFPSVDLVAAEALCSGRTVQRIIQRFTENGLLRLHKRASGRGYPTCYRVDPWAIGDVPEYAELRERQRSGSHPAPALRPSKRLEDHPQGDLLAEKGDTLMSPIAESGGPQKGDTDPGRGDRSGEKGDTLMSSEPLTYNQKERADARPVDNSLASSLDHTDQCHPSRTDHNQKEHATARPAKHSRSSRPREKHQQEDASASTHYRETLEQITEKARAHAISPRKLWEHDFAFRNRVNCQVHILAINQNEARRLNIKKRQPDETIMDFERRVSAEALQCQGIDLSTPPEEARRQALSIR